MVHSSFHTHLKANYYGLSDEGCIACECNALGSVTLQCSISGKCLCKSSTKGDICDTCKQGYWGLPDRSCQREYTITSYLSHPEILIRKPIRGTKKSEKMLGNLKFRSEKKLVFRMTEVGGWVARFLFYSDLEKRLNNYSSFVFAVNIHYFALLRISIYSYDSVQYCSSGQEGLLAYPLYWDNESLARGGVVYTEHGIRIYTTYNHVWDGSRFIGYPDRDHRQGSGD